MGRNEFGLAYDLDRDQVVLFGGIAQFGQQFAYLRDTWTWDGSTWTPRHPGHSPPGGYGVAMAYDQTRGYVVLFGGTDDHSVSGQTWIWDGTDWTLQHPSTSPPPGFGSAMAYDPALSRVVMLLGDEFGNPATTWSWDGTTWVQEEPLVGPHGRVFMASAFDESDNTFLTYGGSYFCGDLGCPVGGTWTWDGTQWVSQPRGDSPGKRSGAAAVYDPIHGVVVMFGGANYGGFDDTWTWDGTTWTNLHPPGSPLPRSVGGMVFDPSLGRVLLFGGVTFIHRELYSLNDLWAWDGTTWSKIG